MHSAASDGVSLNHAAAVVVQCVFPHGPHNRVHLMLDEFHVSCLQETGIMPHLFRSYFYDR